MFIQSTKEEKVRRYILFIEEMAAFTSGIKKVIVKMTTLFGLMMLYVFLSSGVIDVFRHTENPQMSLGYPEDVQMLIECVALALLFAIAKFFDAFIDHTLEVRRKREENYG